MMNNHLKLKYYTIYRNMNNCSLGPPLYGWKYCRYGENHYQINQSINQSTNLSTEIRAHSLISSLHLLPLFWFMAVHSYAYSYNIRFIRSSELCWSPVVRRYSVCPSFHILFQGEIINEIGKIHIRNSKIFYFCTTY